MMRVAAGEMPARDLDVPVDLTPELEVTEKAIARLKVQNPKYKRLIMRYWLGRVPLYEIAAEYHVDDERIRWMLWRAEAQVGRNMIEIEEKLNLVVKKGKLGPV